MSPVRAQPVSGPPDTLLAELRVAELRAADRRITAATAVPVIRPRRASCTGPAHAQPGWRHGFTRTASDAGAAGSIGAEHREMARPEPVTCDVAAGMPHRYAVADLQSVMRLIDDRLDDIAPGVPERKRPLVPNALLNLAIEHLVAVAGAAMTADILRRLAGLIDAGETPDGDAVFGLTGTGW